MPKEPMSIGVGTLSDFTRFHFHYGLRSVVSGHLAGRTQTLTQYVADRFLAFDLTGAYVAAALLGVSAMLTLFGMNALRWMLASDHDSQVLSDAPLLAAALDELSPPASAQLRSDRAGSSSACRWSESIGT